MEDRPKGKNISPQTSLQHHQRVRYRTWGIFQVAHDVDDLSGYFVLSPRAWISTASSFTAPFRSLLRFVADLWRISPWLTSEYYLYNAWMVISPALSAYLGYLVLHSIDTSITYPMGLQIDALQDIQILALMWLSCGLLTHYVVNMLQYESRVKIGPHLRVHFLPQLVQASLGHDYLDDLKANPTSFPSSYDYGDFIPGWAPFDAIFTRLRHLLGIVVEILVTIYIITQQDDSQSHVFSLLVVTFLLVTFLSPIDAVGGKGYSFWTKNTDYNRLMALFNMVFDLQYKQTLIKDGQAQYLCQEYKRVSDSLGPVKADTYTLGWCFYPAWHWGIARFWITNSPMALIALTLPWISSTSPIFLMAVVQYSIFTMKHSIEYLRNNDESFWGLTTRIKSLYDVVDKSPNSGGWVGGPDSTDGQRDESMDGLSDFLGTKISLQNVSHQTLKDVNLDILPGQLVVITGPNGSGKSTLSKLISGTVAPTLGQTIIDDMPLSRAAVHDLRRRTVYTGKSEAIYPISLEENITMTVPNGDSDEGGLHLHEALRLGRSQDIIQELGLRTVLTPCSIPGCSITREVGPGALAALKLNCPDPIPIDIPEDHRQHIIASRAFFRLLMRNINLIILDEATNAMDPIEENHVLTNFRQIARQQGKTVVVVTHNLSSIAKHANMILYMEKGNITEQGTHEQLMRINGGYYTIFKAGG